MRIWRVVGLEAGQWRRAVGLWALLLCVTAAFEFARGAVVSVFLERLGSRALAPAFVLEGGLRLVAAAAYFFLVKRLSYSRLMGLTTAAYGAGLALLSFSLESGSDAGLMACFAMERVTFNLVTLHWGVYVVDFFTVRESSTAFPFIYSAEPLAALPAGLLLVFLPDGIAPSLLFAVPLLLVAAAVGLIAWNRRLAVDSPRVAIHAAAEGKAAQAKAWRYVMTAPIVRHMAIASAVLILVRADLEVSYGQVLEEMFGSAADIRRFWGWYVLAANAVLFVLQFFFSARLTKALAPTRVNLSYAVGVLASFGLLLVLPGVPSVVLSKFAREEMKSFLKTPFSVMIYGAMADFARAHARMAVFGVIMPLASVGSGLLLMAASAGSVDPRWFAWPGLAGGVLFIAVTLLQNRAYKLALIDLLSAKLGLGTHSGLTSTVLKIPDARTFEVQRVRERPDHILVRGRFARKLMPDLYDCVTPEDELTVDLTERLQDLLLAVELYRPKGAPYLRGLLVAAFKDRRVDVVDNALEVVSSILPARLAARGRTMLRLGLEKGLELT